jgi:hypothetical protein
MNIINLPTEIIGKISFMIEDHKDYENFRITCKYFSDILPGCKYICENWNKYKKNTRQFYKKLSVDHIIVNKIYLSKDSLKIYVNTKNTEYFFSDYNISFTIEYFYIRDLNLYITKILNLKSCRYKFSSSLDELTFYRGFLKKIDNQTIMKIYQEYKNNNIFKYILLILLVKLHENYQENDIFSEDFKYTIFLGRRLIEYRKI